jgi:hypothetical protein
MTAKQVPAAAPQRQSWRCLLGFHAWQAARNDAGERYDVCRRCGLAGEWMPTGTGWKAES